MTFIERSATIPFLDHIDYTNCGICWREYLRFVVASEYVEAGKIADKYIGEMYKEIDRRWEETELYKAVKAMLAEGKTIDEIAKIMADKGIEI